MKKILAGVCCSLALGGILFAEKDGFYLGASYQSGVAQMDKGYFKLSDQQTSVNTSQNNQGNGSTAAALNGIGGVVGYKQFFGKPNKKWFGLRYYAFLDWGYANFGKGTIDKDSNGTRTNTDFHGNLFNYGAGIDTLWNVIDKQTHSIGFFAGLAIGGSSWVTNNGNIQFVNNLSYPFAGFETSAKTNKYSYFQLLGNFGLRGNFEKHHGFEVGFKVPFIKHRVLKVVDATQRLNIDLKRNYSFYASYIYTF